MKFRILLMLLAMIVVAVSCSEEGHVDSSNSEVEANSAKRSVIDIIAEYSSAGSDNNLVVKKYESTYGSTNPSVTVTVKSPDVKQMSFLNKTKKMQNGIATVFAPPADFEEASGVNSIQVDKQNYQFQNITNLVLADGDESLSAGHLVEWNLPENGTESEDDVILVIRADYTELPRENPTLYEPTIIVTADDGSYVVTDEDLDAFPTGTPLIITGVRGAYYGVKKSPLVVSTLSIFHSSTMVKG